MKRRMILVLLVFLVFGFTAMTFAGDSIPKKKQTDLGLYLTSKEAYQNYSANPKPIHILDVRTPGEYVFVGHAPMAMNIPYEFFQPGLKNNKLIMPVNGNFVAEVQKVFAKTDTLYVMCRSGSRSARATNLLAQAGFTKVYNIIDGFEGDKDKQGQRTVNGWKNSGAPWTYKYSAELMYMP
jgi:rhodanese-related sulfurtransferase